MPKREHCLNESARAIVGRILASRGYLGVHAMSPPGCANLVDMGAWCPGSAEAGLLLAEACLGGLGRAELAWVSLDGVRLPGVRVEVQMPALACLGSQYAGWTIPVEGGVVMGSGPAQLLAADAGAGAGGPARLLDHAEEADVGVLVLEGRQFPSQETISRIASACNLPPSSLWLLLAPAASRAGLVQIAARVVEVALHKLLHLGYDVSQVESASGVCALVPLVRGDIGNGVRDDVCDGTRDDRLAMGLANDAIAAAGQCQLTLRDRDREIDSVLGRVPWSSSPSFGTPFLHLLDSCGRFGDIDPLMFSPAQIVVTNVATGGVLQAGEPSLAMLQMCFKKCFETMGVHSS
ncbi:MAG TPA: methenyltetrahydromethanopterin cyclohydrolase [Firmicutes bacterium]|nr:methenyltetrahydromethanopterin cyclohydrolase [Bacillota bacterium]